MFGCKFKLSESFWEEFDVDIFDVFLKENIEFVVILGLGVGGLFVYEYFVLLFDIYLKLEFLYFLLFCIGGREDCCMFVLFFYCWDFWFFLFWGKLWFLKLFMVEILEIKFKLKVK